jgi:methylmalonyl-CoA/ethylmalonyl-CoA epimerase
VAKIHHIGVVVDDLDAAKEFAISMLGLELVREIDRPERGVRAAFFKAGDTEIEYLQVAPTYEDGKQGLHGEQARIDHIAFAVDDPQQTYSELSDKGVVFRAPAVQGAMSFFTEPESSDGVTYQFIDAAAFNR